MRYGRHQIDKAGEIAISSTEEDVYKNAIEKINDWRSLHLINYKQKLMLFLTGIE